MSFGSTSRTSRNVWRVLLWADRAGLVALVWQGWRLRAVLTWPEWGWFAGLVLAGLVFHHIASRHALGWIIDENGERQKVQHWSRGYPIFVPTSRGQRIVEEAEMNHERRRALFWATIVGWPLLYLGYRIIHHHRTLGIAAYAIGGFAVLFAFVPMLLGELIYQSGYQDMKGAKVLDPEPYRPGPDDVARQKVHGDADVATAAEARDLLRGR